MQNYLIFNYSCKWYLISLCKLWLMWYHHNSVFYCVSYFLYFLVVTVRGYHWIYTHMINIYFLSVTMKSYHWMFFHLIIIFKGFSPHRLFIFSNFSWLVMCLGFIVSLLTWLTYSLYNWSLKPYKSQSPLLLWDRLI